MDSTQKAVNGTVRMKFYKGNGIVNGMKSESSVYNKALATYSAGDIFDQSASVSSSRSGACRSNMETDAFGEERQSHRRLHHC